ncbi:hypothetical protein [Shimwellia blattae]|uniref:Secreted protein n=1 Tax=Shimwellia blattae (strain ATCC 29907 / DSM 4481 / JCM 1650 / NBRC 105725 / CDC 9005-74) TaxID=630626 RepID=I2B4W9_SHIBC|nr:hypothetical protein [Shimwellia blattae]AFJ45573.1 hypothetical protein EBL_c04470 [Shimwellia blattae DSM 4481 = NBRC 105725]GAB81487.1 hypothetical protein EB105725_14_00540 [Shimwellia blattae DSM 4481 = NBRC 105725]VDY63054.1 Uncharacterised protein [Shimwellia blattae]VEC20208.1 Uncharacterised protein [Shimwellia blattae]
MIIRLFLLTFLSLPVAAHALNFESTDLKLVCPQRGNVEITLHRYNHASEQWGKHFAVGAGHTRHGDLEFVRFTNGDVFIHLNATDEYLFRYAGQNKSFHCRKISERPATPWQPDRIV